MLHNIPPVYDENSKILILGSFPSVKSREEAFFYAHKQNRFWRVMARILNAPEPTTVAEKKRLLLDHGIALWDVVASCDIVGSSDSSITNVIPNDISEIITAARLQRIITNGKKADALYRQYVEPLTGMEAVCLPSTSPANAAWSLDKLCEKWEESICNPSD